MDLDEGQLIKAPFLDGVGEVKKFQQKKRYSLLEVVMKGSGEFKSLRLTPTQVTTIGKMGETLSFVEDSEDFFFLIEASRIRLAYQFDPLLAVNVSQIDPLPHQIEGVYDYVLKSPKIRFLIADDAGAGKTIMAGLVIKELQQRNMADRILIVVPGHLKYQWQREMKEKFSTNLTRINRSVMDASWAENVWEERNQCLTSLDFVKQDDILNSIKSSQWDLVVVDEAHKMSAYKYGNKIDKTQRYRAGEVLSKLATHMLFLTATPHRGDQENFRLFLDLLKPGFFSKIEFLEESIERRENPLFIRRLKENMKDFKGNKLFPPRHVRTVQFRLTPAEKELYNSVTKYVQRYYDKAKENRHITFAMIILQRRLTSSVDAILKSLKRRRKKMEEFLELPEKIKEQEQEYAEIRDITEEELEDMEEKRRMEIEEKLTNLTIARNRPEVEDEIVQLDGLIAKAQAVKEQEVENKLVSLQEKILANLGDRKLLVFTEFKDTMDYLAGKLRSWGYEVSTIDGTMRMDARIDAEKEFKHDTQIMVATEAAGEGINLQFCSWMVNYDVPWNPNRLEQRMGRIHRYGQKREVYIWNMISQDTIEGRILDKMFSKMELMGKAMGTDKIFDVIGKVLLETKFEKSFREAVLGQRRIEEIYDEVDKIDDKQVRETLDRFLLTGLATRHIDYSGTLEKTREAEENRLIPEYIQDYFLRSFDKFGGRVKKVRDYYRVDSVPFQLRKVNKDYSFKKRFGKVRRRYGKVTFDKTIAREQPEYEFVAPGHPLLEAINEKVLEQFSGRPMYSVFGDETGSKEGILWFVQGEIADGTGRTAGKRMFCIYQDLEDKIETVNPSVLWDLKPLSKAHLDEKTRSLTAKRKNIEDYVVNNILFPYREEILESREREARIKKKYGLRSLDYLIQESNSKLLEYQKRQAEGEDMEMPILNETRTKESLEKKRTDLEGEIRLEKNLMVSEPKMIGAAVVIPTAQKTPVTPDRMVSDQEIEKVGMNVSMTYEEEHNWKPEDVSKEDLGFDVRSIKYAKDGTLQQIRYIEVKARGRTGAIRLSANEWKKAKRFQENYWIYIVTNASTQKPQLSRIRNPADRLKIDENIYATGYVIPEENWKKIKGVS